MAEFPDFGKHCANKECKTLDFLPFNCDACKQSFCVHHYRYLNHNCPNASSKDRQVPVCPVCSKPVPIAAGSTPDQVMSAHLDNNCATKKKTSFLCGLKSCKNREFVEVLCSNCKHNFCLKHRFTNDHSCTGRRPNDLLRARTAQQVNQANTAADESLARTLQDLWNKTVNSDEEMARRLQEEEYRTANRRGPTAQAGGERGNGNACTIT
uniref:AN1-type zinc finger protein 2B n=1 Tax=Panagrellus redivivus TaxID=6233 RepID=A0A7E4V3D4_PANRE